MPLSRKARGHCFVKGGGKIYRLFMERSLFREEQTGRGW